MGTSEGVLKIVAAARAESPTAGRRTLCGIYIHENVHQTGSGVLPRAHMRLLSQDRTETHVYLTGTELDPRVGALTHRSEKDMELH